MQQSAVLPQPESQQCVNYHIIRERIDATCPCWRIENGGSPPETCPLIRVFATQHKPGIAGCLERIRHYSDVAHRIVAGRK